MLHVKKPLDTQQKPKIDFWVLSAMQSSDISDILLSLLQCLNAAAKGQNICLVAIKNT